MIQVRRSSERGAADHGWLKSHHTFSFADYYDPKFMGFRSLRVINEDRVEAGRGFGTHGHRDMEIISYVLEGAIAHKDSMGTVEVLKPGEVQRMSAGTGVTHSEFNPSKDDKLHFLQIWIVPEKPGGAPSYEQKDFGDARKNALARIVDRDGRDGAIRIHQDASLFAGVLDAGVSVKHELAAGRYGWVQVARGEVTVLGQKLAAGDGAAIGEERALELTAGAQGAEVLVFDLA